MSMIDSGLMSSLAANLMAPTASAMAPGLAGLYNDEDQRRRPRPGPTAHTMTPGMGQPLPQHLQQAKQAFQAASQQQAMQQAQPRPAVPASPAAAPAQQQDFNPAGVTLGEQEGGGRNVELIRGGRSEVQHFNAQGDNTGVLPPANSGTAAASAAFKQAGLDPQAGSSLMQAGMSFKDAMANLQKSQAAPGEKATWKDQMAADKGQYADLVRQAQHAETMAGHTFGAQKATFLAQAQQLHGQATEIGKQLFHPQAIQNYQQKFRDQEAAATQRDQQFQETQDQLTKMGAGKEAAYPPVPRAPKLGTKITPEAIQAISTLAKTREEAEKLAKDAGWSF